MNHIKSIASDFSLFWNIRIPKAAKTWIVRAFRSRKAQDAALYGASILAVGLLASGVLA